MFYFSTSQILSLKVCSLNIFCNDSSFEINVFSKDLFFLVTDA